MLPTVLKPVVYLLQIDRIEAEVMQLVPGVMYVDLETDRGRFSSYSKATKSFDEVEDISASLPVCCFHL